MGCADSDCADAGCADAGCVDAGCADAGCADAGCADAGCADPGPAPTGCVAFAVSVLRPDAVSAAESALAFFCEAVILRSGLYDALKTSNNIPGCDQDRSLNELSVMA